MIVAAPLPLASAEEVQSDPPHRKWTVAEFERASEVGLFGPEERLELN